MEGVTFVSYLPLILVFVLFFLRVPAGFSMILASILYFTFMNDTMPIDLALQNLITSIQDFNLLAVPFFIMAGVIMNYSGISARLMEFCELLVGHLPGGLGQVNVLLSTLMGGVSGSGNADTAMQCKMLVPQMVKRGYSVPVAAAITATSSIIPAVIPPGIVMILYCMAAHASIGQTFAAGYIPGILMCVALMITTGLVARKNKYPATRERMASPREIVRGAGSAMLALFMPLGLLMGLRFGMFTATEGGAIAVFYCAIVGGLVYRNFKLKHIWPVLKETFISYSQVMLIIMGAKLFGYYLTFEMIPDHLSSIIMGFAVNKYVFLLAVVAFLLFVGMFMEVSPCMFIFVPLLMTPLQAMGIDLVHFGIVMTITLMIGGITPPYGSMMFIACSMTDTKMEDFVKANVPFLLTIVLVDLLVIFIEPIALFLPTLMYR